MHALARKGMHVWGNVSTCVSPKHALAQKFERSRQATTERHTLHPCLCIFLTRFNSDDKQRQQRCKRNGAGGRNSPAVATTPEPERERRAADSHGGEGSAIRHGPSPREVRKSDFCGLSAKWAEKASRRKDLNDLLAALRARGKVGEDAVNSCWRVFPHRAMPMSACRL